MTGEADDFTRLAEACAAAGPEAMLDSLADLLRGHRRWHAVVDVRLMQARMRLGLPPTGDTGPLAAADRERFDDLSLAACREAGWPLLDEGQVAAAWMYLRAAAEPAVVAERLTALAGRVLDDPAAAADEESSRLLQEIVGVALWEGVDPALGIDVILRTQGTCPAITAFDQAAAGLPAARQRPAADRLVAHLHAGLVETVAADLAHRGSAPPSASGSLAALLDSAGGLADASIHCDVSHLHAVLRIARVCTDAATLTRAWELACYACRLPADVAYPGQPPFQDLGPASRLFYGAQIGRDVDATVAYFAAAAAAPADAGPLPAEALALLLWRLGRPAAALDALLDRPRDRPQHGESLPAGTLPSVVELAAAAGDFAALRAACRERGDEITFAATLVAEAHQRRGQPLRGAHAAHSEQSPGR